MKDVGSDKERADDRSIFGEVRVLDPVHDAGNEIGERGDEYDLEDNSGDDEREMHGGYLV